MVGSFILYHAESRNTAMERSIRRRREWRVRGSAAAGPKSKSPHQQRTRKPRQSEIESYAVPKGRKKEDPAARPSGRKVPRSAKDLKEDAVSTWPAGRILPLKKFSLPRSTGRARVSTSLNSIKDLRIGRGRSKHTVLRGCAKNRRKTRGAWTSADGSHCSASNLERTTPSAPGDSD